SFTAALADLARTEVILARYRRAATAALAAADGCLARLLAAVAPGWDFDTMLAGPDGATGTADDGTLLAPAGCSAGARRPPGAATPARLLVTVDAGAAGGRRRLEAIVGRARVAGDLVVDAPRSGAGLLFVEGTLDIRSALDFTGLVVAAGGLRISAGGSLAVGGALWVSGTGGPALLVDGSLRLRQSRAAMDDVDQLLPLPRRAVLLGVKDLS